MKQHTEIDRITGPKQAPAILLAILFTVIQPAAPNNGGPIIMQESDGQVTVIQPRTGRLLVGDAPRPGHDSVLIEINPGKGGKLYSPAEKPPVLEMEPQ